VTWTAYTTQSGAAADQTGPCRGKSANLGSGPHAKYAAAMKPPTAEHWQSVYQTKPSDQVSWYAPHLSVSLALLQRAGVHAGSRVIDIGAGASTLVDDLLDLGVKRITAVDIADAPLEVARQRLGERGHSVRWLVADAAHLDLPPQGFDLWHDRAALHFLVEPAEAAAYVATANRAIACRGYAVIGGFAADGPEKCSNLPVVRREPQDLAALFGPAFSLVHAEHERHTTPWGSSQSFAYALLRKRGAEVTP
jgi:SAM-dependent methyltransferase